MGYPHISNWFLHTLWVSDGILISSTPKCVSTYLDKVKYWLSKNTGFVPFSDTTSEHKKGIRKREKERKNKECHKTGESYFIHKSLGYYLEIQQALTSSEEEI